MLWISRSPRHVAVVFIILKQICCTLLTSQTACWHLIRYQNKAFCRCVFCRKLSLVKLQHGTCFCKLGNISCTPARGMGCEFSMEMNPPFHSALLQCLLCKSNWYVSVWCFVFLLHPPAFWYSFLISRL